MEPKYLIPAKGVDLLDVGQWVEIFEAYGEADGPCTIRVKSMRVGGRMLAFPGERDKSPRTRALRPHEGRVAFVEQGKRGTRFGIRLRS